MAEKGHLLFVCTANQQRSPTGERIYENDPRFEVRSAGTDALLGRRVSEDDLTWADLVVVMEERHARHIRREFPSLLDSVEIVVLDIPDIYQYMEQRLQREIKGRLEPILKRR